MIDVYLRPLTDTELALCREAKKAANEVLKGRRQEIARQIKKLPRADRQTRNKLQREHDALKNIAGKPVIISLNGENMRLNYELLQELNKSLEKRGWHRKINVKRHTMTIEYQTGIIELNELPAYQLELLWSLPVINLEYDFDFLN